MKYLAKTSIAIILLSSTSANAGLIKLPSYEEMQADRKACEQGVQAKCKKGLIDLSKKEDGKKDSQSEKKPTLGAKGNVPQKSPLKRGYICDGVDVAGLDFAPDFARAKEKFNAAQASTNPRFNDEFATRRSNSFFGIKAPAETAKPKSEAADPIMGLLEKEWSLVKSLPLAVEATISAEPQSYRPIRFWLAELSTNYDSENAQNVRTSMDPKVPPTSTLISEDPFKSCAIQISRQVAEKTFFDGAKAKVNYESPTKQQNRATPKQIEDRLIGKD